VTHTGLHEPAVHEYAQPVRDRELSQRTTAEAEATAISRATAVIAAVLVVTAGVFSYFGMLQISGLALFGALAMSIASVAGRKSRGYRWVGPAIVGIAMLTVVVAGFIHR
jgi:hypothetical protein